MDPFGNKSLICLKMSKNILCFHLLFQFSNYDELASILGYHSILPPRKNICGDTLQCKYFRQLENVRYNRASQAGDPLGLPGSFMPGFCDKLWREMRCKGRLRGAACLVSLRRGARYSSWLVCSTVQRCKKARLQKTRQAIPNA